MPYRNSLIRPRTFNRPAVFFVLFAAACVAFVTGCSLIKVDMQGEAIPENQMNVRLSTNEFAIRFAETVEFTADTILAQTTDLEIQLNALRWKINAFQAIRHVSFRTAPYEAFIDTWVLVAQMSDFFRMGAGQDLFGEWQGLVVTECDSLQSDITAIAQGTRTPVDFETVRDFVLEEARTHPLTNLSMDRRSAVPDWRKYMGIPDSAAVTTVGTLPQAVTQVGAQVVTIAEHTPKEARWNVEMLRRKSRIDSLQLAARLDSLTSLLERISTVAESSPEILGQSIDLLAIQLQAALAEVDLQRSATLIAIAEERAAIVDAFERERAAVLQALDKTAATIVDTSLKEVRSLVMRALLIIVVVLIILLVTPFVLGYIVGKSRASRADTS